METKFKLNPKLIYSIPKEKNKKEQIIKILKKHQEIKFISFVGIDLWGNDTDEKIPVKYFIENIDEMLEKGIQTDGSSVDLANIATLEDARVDLIPDKEATWYVDYNYDNIDTTTNLPTGTLRIWSYLLHNGKYVDSRHILKKSLEEFKQFILEKLKNKTILESYHINSVEDIQNIEVMLGTELEFWVRTPYDVINVEKLIISQNLKEQYWKRTTGVVRTALEKTLRILEFYGIKPEMGHKEVGGVTTYVSENESIDNHIVEQLEIDWKYDKAIQAADKELLARIIIKEIFRLHGLEVSFSAKPIIGVAGNGKHCHFSIMAKLKDGRNINLLTPTEENTYLSNIGWGMLMGILKHYHVINPFVSNTNDSLNRLKPGYEAPTHTVASIGKAPNQENRNRTVLLGLVKDKYNPLSTRFELRSPNPKTNVFLTASAVLATVVDGIEFAINDKISNKELEQEFCKDFAKEGKYLSKNRIYREEKDIFETYTEEEREHYFGKSPKTVYENIANLKEDTVLEKLIDREIIEAHIELTTINWILDLEQRIIPSNRQIIKSCVELENANEYDQELWNEITELKNELAKDNKDTESIITQITKLSKNKEFDKLSDLQIEMNQKMQELKELYNQYKNNQM